MTILCSGTGRLTVAGGGALEVAALTPEGLDVLYGEGWEALRRRLGRPAAWFRAESLLRRAPQPAVSAREAFLVAEDVETEAGSDEGARQGRVLGARLCRLLYVHAGVRWFEGHFPGRPILPGVVQVGWAAAQGEQIGFPGAAFAGLSGVKFAAPVLPGAVVSLTLTAAAPERLTFLLKSRQGVHSRGVLHYRV